MTTELSPTLAFINGQSGMMIFVLLLLMFGAKKLPELAKGLGQAIKEFSKAKNDIQDEIMREPEPRPQPPRQIDTQHTAYVPQPAPGTQPAYQDPHTAPAQPAPHPTQPTTHA